MISGAACYVHTQLTNSQTASSWPRWGLADNEATVSKGLENALLRCNRKVDTSHLLKRHLCAGAEPVCHPLMATDARVDTVENLVADIFGDFSGSEPSSPKSGCSRCSQGTELVAQEVGATPKKPHQTVLKRRHGPSSCATEHDAFLESSGFSDTENDVWLLCLLWLWLYLWLGWLWMRLLLP